MLMSEALCSAACIIEKGLNFIHFNIGKKENKIKTKQQQQQQQKKNI